MTDIITTFLGSGWKTYGGALLFFIGAFGLAADYVAQLLGMDIYDQVTTWDQVVTMFGLGLGLLGIRHRLAKGETKEPGEFVVAVEDMRDNPNSGW